MKPQTKVTKRTNDLEHAVRDLHKRGKQADANYAYMADVMIKLLDHLGLEVNNKADGEPVIAKRG